MAVRGSSYIRLVVTIEVNGQIRVLGIDVSSVICLPLREPRSYASLWVVVRVSGGVAYFVWLPVGTSSRCLVQGWLSRGSAEERHDAYGAWFVVSFRKRA